MPERPQSPARTISDELTALYKSRYGRGPTTVAVHLVPGAVACILQDVNTPAQRALVENGDVDVAQATHHRLQLGMAEEMTRIVERATGTAVATYIPGFNAVAGATTDVFVLRTGPERG